MTTTSQPFTRGDLGPRAMWIDTHASPVAPAEWAQVARDVIAGVTSAVPGASRIVIEFDDRRTSADAIASQLRDHAPSLATTREVAHLDLPVSYDGPDLESVAKICGLTPAEVVARHSSVTYRVAFCGFCPGFAYLTGLDPALHVPRLESPRTEVPAGSLAIAADYSAIYPTSSPGGWHLLGSCSTVLFDTQADPPALLRPGMTVRFEPEAQ